MRVVQSSVCDEKMMFQKKANTGVMLHAGPPEPKQEVVSILVASLTTENPMGGGTAPAGSNTAQLRTSSACHSVPLKPMTEAVGG